MKKDDRSAEGRSPPPRSSPRAAAQGIPCDRAITIRTSCRRSTRRIGHRRSGLQRKGRRRRYAKVSRCAVRQSTSIFVEKVAPAPGNSPPRYPHAEAANARGSSRQFTSIPPPCRSRLDQDPQQPRPFHERDAAGAQGFVSIAEIGGRKVKRSPTASTLPDQ